LSPAIELVVILDEVAPETEKLINRWVELTDNVCVIKSANRGISAALNAGLAKCQGDLVARMDADDILVGNRFILQQEFLAKHPKVVAVGSQVRFIDEAGKTLGESRLPFFQWQINVELNLWNPLAHPTMMYRRDELIAIGGYSEDILYAQDFDLARRMSKRGRIANLSHIGLLYRVHDNQVSKARVSERISAVARILSGPPGRGLGPKKSMRVAELTSQNAQKSKLLLAIGLYFFTNPLQALGIVASKVVTFVFFTCVLPLRRPGFEA
jgi:glycosyltransferase involved in cell wall biosynthesis